MSSTPQSALSPVISAPRVFISYSHDSEPHRDRVRALADRLRNEGIDAWIDQYSPGETNWPIRMTTELERADFVLLICTETYHRRVQNRDGADRGFGVLWEAQDIYARLYLERSRHHRFLPVLYSDCRIDSIPLHLRAGDHYKIDDPTGYTALYRVLTRQHAPVPALGSITVLPPAPRPALAQSLWSIPAPIHHFHNRPDLLSAIDRSLSARATALTALHGLGGIGKTQLSLAFARDHRTRYSCGVQIAAESPASITSSFAALAPRLNVPVSDQTQVTADAVVDAIASRQPFLVIFDNAESPADLRPWTDRLTSGHVLITSRSENWDGLASAVAVEKWSIEESARFLLERTGQKDQASAEALAADLDGLILALDHAASYMLAGDRMSLAEYRRIWRDRLARTPRGHSYEPSVAASIGLSLDAVAQKLPAAYDVLCLFSWLAPDRIPRKELLEAGAPELLADRDRWNDIISTLADYSLLRRERDQDNATTTGYYMHRVVQQIVRDRQPDPQWFTKACDAVNKVFPYDESSFWSSREALLPHVRIIHEHARKAEAPASLCRLLNQAGIYLRQRGLYAEASDFAQTSLDLALKQFGPDHPDVAIRRSNLANILRDLGEHAEARKQVELALESALRAFGPDHPDVATSRSNLAIILGDLGEHAEARKQIELALESDLRNLGPDHPNVATRRSNLAIILGDLGEHAEARKQVELALESGLRNLGPDHPSVAISRSNLAIILRDLGEHAEARKQVELALESGLRNLGPDHPSVAISRSNLANILGDLGEHAEARKQVELALESDLRNLGPDHPNVATSRSNLAIILGDLGEHAEARKQVELALESGLRNLGPDHPSVATSRSNLAAILYRLNDRPAALREIDQALDVFRRTLPPGHPHIRTAEGWRKTILGQ